MNPDHLSLGTQRANQLDKLRKGRQARGSRHGRAKLSEADVRWLRAAKRHGEAPSVGELAERFSVSRRAITLILEGRNWRHI